MIYNLFNNIWNFLYVSEEHIFSNGDIVWTKKGWDNIRHRLDGPAIINKYLSCWYKNNKKHRVDGPAFEHINGTKEWFLKGELVYSKECNNLSNYDLSESFKRSIIKYELSK
jgi:hypothetical protein